MAINVAEITSVLKREIASFEEKVAVSEVGTVIEVGDGIARIYGLRNAMAGELLEFENGTLGQVFNLEEDSIGAVIFGHYLEIKEGDSVKSTGRLLEVPVGDAVIGRVVNPLGQPIDGGPAIPLKETRKMDIVAPGIAERQPVKEPLQTGIKAIDSMIPIGRGQRELIIGDRKTGKTAIAIDTIIAQKGMGVKCFYVAIGSKEATVAGIVEVLKSHGAMEYTTVVVASAADPAPLQYIAPYAGCAMAEYFMWKGGATLCVYDDLTKQAAAYRELEAFAQLGTELDKATQAQLDRGSRLVELLKQPQYKPMTIEQQVMVIYAGTKGYLDDVPVSRVQEFQTSFLQFVDSSAPG